jgi:SAM-dependent methyltransferase
VERRSELPSRSPIDSAGKRAAFALFYAPLHLLTAREVVRGVGASTRPVDTIVDLGCGTGVASAAWALMADHGPRLQGVDTAGWALAEAGWNWRQLGLVGAAKRADLVEAASRLLTRTTRASLRRTAVVAGWSMNELPRAARAILESSLLSLAEAGASVLVMEPLSRRVTPWWDEWARAVVSAGGRADEWKFDVALPPRLAAIDEAAGFDRESLGARSTWLSAEGRPRRG